MATATLATSRRGIRGFTTATAQQPGRAHTVSPRREGIGPHRVVDGAIMKQTFTGKDKCWHRVCTNKPIQIVTDPFGQKVWVCKGHVPRNPYEDK